MDNIEDIMTCLAKYHKTILQKMKLPTLSTKQKSNLIKQVAMINNISLQIIKLNDLSTADVTDKTKTNSDANW
jgi:hypothetical protein